jgi:hypothetical protein
MTLTLMAPYEDDNEPETVFPDTEMCLFIGGPAQGETREVVHGDQSFRVIAPPAAPTIAPDVPFPLMAGGVPVVNTYLRREFVLEDDKGEVYKRTVYVHDSVPNPAIAQRLLMAALLAAWVREGERVPQDELPTIKRYSGG